METAVFYLISATVIISALIVVSLENIARALFLFFVVLLGVAALYVFALADFVAIIQIMVYVGGVLILMLFAFMLSSKELLKSIEAKEDRFISVPKWSAVLMCSLLLAILLSNARELLIPTWVIESIKSKQVLSSTDNTIENIGYQFMTRYVFQFEFISIFLLAALIGATHIARKDKTL